MSDMNIKDIGRYHIVLEKIINDKNMMTLTRLLAAELMATPYKTVGDFFKNISDVDLRTLITIIETNGADERYGDILLITHMLHGAEGFTQFDNLDGITDRTNQFTNYAIITSLHRKGLVKAYFENMSFGDDMQNKIIVEKIE